MYVYIYIYIYVCIHHCDLVAMAASTAAASPFRAISPALSTSIHTPRASPPIVGRAHSSSPASLRGSRPCGAPSGIACGISYY